MAWIESHQELRNHPKLARLSRELKIAKVTAIGHLHALWWWCMDYAPDGQTSDWTNGDLADGAMWEGDADTFINALILCRWIDADGKIHDWMDFAGRILDKRAQERERKRKLRSCPQDIRTLSAGHPQDIRCPVEVPNLTRPNQTLPDQPNQTIAVCNDKTVTDSLPATARKKPRANGVACDSKPTWDAFQQAYLRRYKVEHSRNATTNSQMCQFIKRIGLQEAPLVAAYYVNHQNSDYVRKRHTVGIMLLNAEAIHTDWATGSNSTFKEAREADRFKADDEMWDRIEQRQKQRKQTIDIQPGD